MSKQVKTEEQIKLKEFMQEHFHFSSMKKGGVFPKEMKFNDYEGQAERICKMFDLESVYDYANIGRGAVCHISHVHPTPFDRFIEPIGPPLMQVEGKTTKVVPFNKKPVE